MRLENYIKQFYESKAEFARVNKMSKQQLNGMLRRGYWYVKTIDDGSVYLMQAKKEIECKF